MFVLLHLIRTKSELDSEAATPYKGEHSMWLICGTTLGRGKNKLLVRGIEGAEWVFCPIVRSSKGGRVSTDSCQGCRHFIRFEQTHIPQARIMKKTFFMKTTSPKETFHIARTLNRSRATHPSFARAGELNNCFARLEAPLVTCFFLLRRPPPCSPP